MSAQVEERNERNFKKRLALEPSLYTILQILSVTIFEKMPLSQALTENDVLETIDGNDNQLKLFT